MNKPSNPGNTWKAGPLANLPLFPGFVLQPDRQRNLRNLCLSLGLVNLVKLVMDCSRRGVTPAFEIEQTKTCSSPCLSSAFPTVK